MHKGYIDHYLTLEVLCQFSSSAVWIEHHNIKISQQCLRVSWPVCFYLQVLLWSSSLLFPCPSSQRSAGDSMCPEAGSGTLSITFAFTLCDMQKKDAQRARRCRQEMCVCLHLTDQQLMNAKSSWVITPRDMNKTPKDKTQRHHHAVLRKRHTQRFWEPYACFMRVIK